jgi:hypothetical protein
MTVITPLTIHARNSFSNNNNACNMDIINNNTMLNNECPEAHHNVSLSGQNSTYFHYRIRLLSDIFVSSATPV